MMKMIHWGMVGTGDVTEVKSGPGLYKADNSTLYGVTNRTRAKAEDYARRHGVARVYDNLEQMLADPQIDAVYIATPPDSHMELAIQCAKAKKTCYIEKPLALNYNEALEIIKAFEANDTKAFVAFYRRRLPRFLKVKELLESGVIGEVRFVHVSLFRPAKEDEMGNCWRVRPDISGGGVFIDVAAHQLDILGYLVGRINQVKSFYGNQAHYYQPEDIVNLCFTFENGVQGSGDWCFTAGVSKDVIEIVGSKGRITLECFGTGTVLLETPEGVKAFDEPTPVHVQQPLIQSIVDELNGVGLCPSTIDTAAETALVCDMVYGKE